VALTKKYAKSVKLFPHLAASSILPFQLFISDFPLSFPHHITIRKTQYLLSVPDQNALTPNSKLTRRAPRFSQTILCDTRIVSSFDNFFDNLRCSHRLFIMEILANL
jgi:hypothetical protein